MSFSPPVALTIAGSDNSAGAGIQADLKTFSRLGVYGVTAVTCVVAELPRSVTALQPVDDEMIRDQIRLSFDGFPISAVKTGLLYSRSIIESVCDVLEVEFSKRGQSAAPFLVVDPVMVATSGDPLLKKDAVAVYQDRLFKIATVVTPNLDEAGALMGRSVSTVDEMREAGRELSERFGAAFLLKGGHLRTGDATDLLFKDGDIREFTGRFVPGVATHGTGCTFSAAIAAGLAKGLALDQAITEAKRFVTDAITNHFTWARGENTTSALNHGIQVPDFPA